MIMTNKIRTSINLCYKLLLKKHLQKTIKKKKMTVFVHQNKFFSKEYFGSSFKIILVVFYVLNFWDTDFEDVSLYKMTFFRCSGLMGWEGCLV